MSREKEIKWLYGQLPALVEKGIITEEQAAGIRGFFGQPEEGPSYNIAFLVVGILGALLIGGGIILIFAYNWEDLSRAWRTALSFAPLVLAQMIYGYVFFRKSDSPAWVESASAFLMLMLGSCIALISQTYHIGGSAEDFLWTWMLLSIPLMYLTKSSLVAVIYLIGIAAWAINVRGGDSVWYWALLAAAIPHLVLHIRNREESIRRNVLGWTLPATLAFAWFGVIEEEIAEFSFFGTALLLSGFFLLGKQLFPESGFIRRPFQNFALAGILIFLLFLTYEPGSLSGWNLMDSRYAPVAAYVNLAVLVLILIGFVYFFIKGIRERTLSEHFTASFPFLVLIFIWVMRSGGQWTAVGIANVFMLGYGVSFLYAGIRERSLRAVNLGMLILLALITARFFDSDWSFVVKGVIFVILGMGFLGVNFLLARRMKGDIDKN